MSATRAAVTAFREDYLGSEGPFDTDFNSNDARQLRYALSWGIYSGTVYRTAHHSWSDKLRADLGLYDYIRTIFSPATRLVDFHVAHIMGGSLDPNAGDGQTIPSALPILISDSNKDRDAALRRAISVLWGTSNWALAKDHYTRWGGALGDVVLEAVNDPLRKKMYIDVVHPSLFPSVTFDKFLNVKAYVREEVKEDPERDGKQVLYREEVTRDGSAVVYRTYRDDKPYAWSQDLGEEWEEPYGFVPLVFHQHINVGLDFGWSEFHSLWSKIREADDVGSVLDDQIRILLNSPWFITGAQGQANTTVTRTTTDTNNREKGRAEIPMVYGPIGAEAKPMVAPMPIGETSDHIEKLLEEIERDRPELRFDRLRASGDASGTALRVARQPAETKVNQYRAGYDDALVRAQKMAIAIGGHFNYEGFEGFSLDSYAAGDLDHRIGDRPVFGVDIMERMEEDKARWEVVQVAAAALGQAGALAALREMGWDEVKLAALVTAIEEREQAERDRFAQDFNRA